MKAPFAAALLALGLPAFAQQQQQQEAKPLEPGREALTIAYEKYQLPNGLEVILARDPKLPVVAVNVWYHVGAYNEQPGRTGFAHLFEHMMFQGSKHVPEDVHIALLEKRGATDLNGTTNYDRTNYFETVPSNQLELALWLESDRMGYLLDALDDKKLAQPARGGEERAAPEPRDAPYGLAQEKLWQALFPAPHPYHGKVIGSMADLDAATLDDVKAFFRTWYSPANATLALVGDFEPEQARALVEKYFASLPATPKPPKPQVAAVQHTHEQVIRHDEKVGTLPLVQVAWLTPPYFSEGDATADVLAHALGTGKSSLLYQRLVADKGIAQSVSAYQQSLGAQSSFIVEAVARPGITSDALLKELDAVLEEVRRKGVTPRQISQVRTTFETQMLSGLQSVGGGGGKADTLQSYNHFLNDPGYLTSDLARYDAVTPERVRDLAREFLAPERRVVLHAVPQTAPQKEKP